MRDRFLDSIYVGILLLYVLAGCVLVPFHGDESTTIYMSHDWYTMIQSHNLRSLLYRPMPPAADMQGPQDLRIIASTLSTYVNGMVLSLGGTGVDQLPKGPWTWSEDWWVNRYYGQLPSEPVLFFCRVTSALMAALSAAVVFAIARRLAGRVSARISAFVYATIPAVLLNGRRAIFEGAMLLTSTLMLLVGIEVARRMRHPTTGSVLKSWLLLGTISGLALSAKQTTAFIIVPVFGSLLIVGWRDPLKTVRDFVLGAVMASGVFLAINPVYWNAPLEVLSYLLKYRSQVMATQVLLFGGFKNSSERITAPMNFLLGQPQYAEDTVSDWPHWIGGQITAYEASGLAGIDWSSLSVLIYAVPAVGLLVFLTRRNPARLILISTFIFSAVAIILINLLPWQRYYLPLAPFVAILSGTGAQTLMSRAWQYIQHVRTPEVSMQAP